MTNIVSCFLVYKLEPFKFSFKVKIKITALRFYFANNFLGSIYQYLDQVLVGMIFSKEALAYLNILKQIINTLNSLSVAISRYYMPVTIKSLQISGIGKNVINVTKIIIVFSFVTIISVLFVLPSIISWITNDNYIYSTFAMLVISTVFLLTTTSVLLDNHISIPLNKVHYTTISNIIVATCSLGSFIHYSSYLTPLIGLAIGEFIGGITIIYLHFFSRKVQNTKDWFANYER
ncbi:lipopolysaccharide biosynthesis protein [Algibacillus agarilyticus]|uniref:lipopolysaccharide biosynthesis protein n=1 Tax=Algibacillus agarilyticus TaxID=2234133 RepID=UPI00130065CD|nr:hypothetical protein [Algibacillus agarilyticus]